MHGFLVADYLVDVGDRRYFYEASPGIYYEVDHLEGEPHILRIVLFIQVIGQPFVLIPELFNVALDRDLSLLDGLNFVSDEFFFERYDILECLVRRLVVSVVRVLKLQGMHVSLPP